MVGFAIAEQDLGMDHRRRDAGKVRDMARRQIGIFSIAGHPVQAVEHAPAQWQGRIDRHCIAQVGNCVGRVAPGDVAQPPFEIHLAEMRVMLGQAHCHCQRLVGALGHA